MSKPSRPPKRKPAIAAMQLFDEEIAPAQIEDNLVSLPAVLSILEKRDDNGCRIPDSITRNELRFIFLALGINFDESEILLIITALRDTGRMPRTSLRQRTKPGKPQPASMPLFDSNL